MTPLESLLKEKSPLTIAEFMRITMTHETYGYYTTQKPIGPEGDFTTAPEISQLFGEMIGLWAANMWEQLDAPPHLKWVELGPGRGTLLQDALRITRTIPGFQEALSFAFVEVNPDFQSHQQHITPQANWYTTWQSCLDHLSKEGMPFILIANEFLDTLPIHQYRSQNHAWYERHVEFKEDAWTTIDIPTNPLPHQEDGIYEVCPEAQSLIQQLSEMLKTQKGAALFIDYSYREGHGDSFQALFKGKPVSPLSHIGQADLTAHVDFGILKNLSPTAYGPLSQGDFLHNLGIAVWKEKLKAKSSLDKKAQIEAQYQRLTHPLQMGSLFKVMALSHPTLQPAGFP